MFWIIQRILYRVVQIQILNNNNFSEKKFNKFRVNAIWPQLKIPTDDLTYALASSKSLYFNGQLCKIVIATKLTRILPHYTLSKNVCI